MTQQDTLNKAIEYLKYQGLVSSKTDLAEQMGANRVSVSRACSGDPAYLTTDFIQRLNTTFGSIFSPSWLLTGEGSMLVENSPSEVKKTSSDVENTTSEEKLKQIPVLPIAAQGGSLNDFTLSVRMYDCEWMASPNPNADFAIEVAGESMMPEYPPGARVFIKRINERAFIEWGEVFVLDTENGIVLKQVHPADDENFIRCVSINPNYAPFNIPKASIFGMYIVLGVYAKKK